jgi:hypothetical protein
MDHFILLWEKKTMYSLSEAFVLNPDWLLLFHSMKSKQKSCQNEPSAGRFDSTRSDQSLLKFEEWWLKNCCSEFFTFQNGVQPSVGEILVARGKRRRSGTPGMKERKETVLDRSFQRQKSPFGRNGIRLQNCYSIRDLEKVYVFCLYSQWIFCFILNPFPTRISSDPKWRKYRSDNLLYSNPIVLIFFNVDSDVLTEFVGIFVQTI